MYIVLYKCASIRKLFRAAFPSRSRFKYIWGLQDIFNMFTMRVPSKVKKRTFQKENYLVWKITAVCVVIVWGPLVNSGRPECVFNVQYAYPGAP